MIHQPLTAEETSKATEHIKAIEKALDETVGTIPGRTLAQIVTGERGERLKVKLYERDIGVLKYLCKIAHHQLLEASHASAS